MELLLLLLYMFYVCTLRCYVRVKSQTSIYYNYACTYSLLFAVIVIVMIIIVIIVRLCRILLLL